MGDITTKIYLKSCRSNLLLHYIVCLVNIINRLQSLIFQFTCQNISMCPKLHINMDLNYVAVNSKIGVIELVNFLT